MAISYKKLWKLLIDKDMKKKDLEKALQSCALRHCRKEKTNLKDCRN